MTSCGQERRELIYDKVKELVPSKWCRQVESCPSHCATKLNHQFRARETGQSGAGLRSAQFKI